MDWAKKRIVSQGRLFDLPLDVRNGSGHFTITSAYDPSVMTYRGEHWLAFECYGPNFRGSAAVCMSPLDLNRGIDTSRLYVAVEGRSVDPGDEAHTSASVPKLLSFDGRAFLYWTAVRIRKADNVWLGLTVRGVELAPDSDGRRVVANDYGPGMPSNHSLAVEVMGPEPGSQLADAYEIRKIGSAFYLFGSSGECLVPSARTPGCYHLTIRKSRVPLGRHIFNRDRVPDSALPSNPVQYMRVMETPQGKLRLLGQVLPPTDSSRAEPAGMFSYAFDLGASGALLATAGASDQNAAFLEKAYRVLLDRAADEAGMAAHKAALARGTEKRALLASLLLSPEARQKFRWERMSDREFVEFLYRRILGRAADPGGLRSWTQQMAVGKLSRETAVERFFAAEEFAQRRPDLL